MSDDMNRMFDQNNPDENDGEALEEGDLIEMIGEDGETLTFIFVDALEYEGDMYLALADQEEDDAVFFLKLEQDEEGNDIYTAPEEELEDILFDRFEEMRGTDEE